MYFNSRNARFNTLTAALAFFALSGCASKTPGPAPIYAVVRFENLSGDQSLDWVGRAASEVLSSTLSNALDGVVLTPSSLARVGRALGPHPAGVPGSSAQRQEALLSGANRLISGYLRTGAGGLVLTATDEDLLTGKIVRTATASGRDAVRALASLGTRLSPKAVGFATSNAEALELYCQAWEVPAQEAGIMLQRVVRIDPDFGRAWDLAVALKLASGDRPGAEALITQARTRKLTAFDQASLAVSEADIHGDAAAKFTALKKLTTLSPGDTGLLRSVAEAETNQGKFAEAAVDWKRLATLLPRDADAWNQLGYNRSWSGDYPGALSALAQYAQIRPAEPNPLDSAGDVHFMNRKYAEAARSYAAAHAKSPGFERYADLYKGAWAKFRAGDKAGADKTFEEFRTLRGQGNPAAMELFQADWLFRTGRRKEAVALLRARVAGSDGSPDDVVAKINAYAQLAVWDLIAGDRIQAAKDALAAGQPRTLALAMIRIASMPSASAPEWAARVEKSLPGPALAGLRNIALGYALLLDGKKSEAIPVWMQIAKAAPPTDFPLQYLAESVRGATPKLALIPNHDAVNNFAVLYGDL